MRRPIRRTPGGRLACSPPGNVWRRPTPRPEPRVACALPNVQCMQSHVPVVPLTLCDGTGAVHEGVCLAAYAIVHLLDVSELPEGDLGTTVPLLMLLRMVHQGSFPETSMPTLLVIFEMLHGRDLTKALPRSFQGIFNYLKPLFPSVTTHLTCPKCNHPDSIVLLPDGMTMAQRTAMAEDTEIACCGQCGAAKFREGPHGPVPITRFWTIDPLVHLQGLLLCDSLAQLLVNPCPQPSADLPEEMLAVMHGERWRQLQAHGHLTQHRHLAYALTCDGLCPYGLRSRYSCWIISMYLPHLPPSLARRQGLFMPLVVFQGKPKSLNGCLRPLVDKLEVAEEGVSLRLCLGCVRSCKNAHLLTRCG